MSTAAATRLTEQEYLERERAAEFKSEFVDGEIFAMAGGSSRHAQLSVNASAEIRAALKGRPCQAFSSDLKVRSPFAGSIHYPDVSALCGPAEFADNKDDVLLNPTLLVEVLSPSTEDYDRGRKFLAYRSLPSLVDYLLVASDEHLVEYYTRRADGNWLLASYRDFDDLVTLPGLDITLGLGDLYAGVEFPAAESP